MKISVPATTANLGPGFDSFGLALNLYLEVEVIGESSDWQIEHEISGLSKDKSNLVIETLLSLAPNVSPKKLKMKTEIPTTRGLGSSSSAIVAGIELANQLGELNLSSEEKLKIANTIEGHPDNVAPAILGDFVVAKEIDESIYYNQHAFPACGIIAVIPPYELRTEDSRGVLPENISFKYGVEASSISNMALSYLLTGNIEKACLVMENDMWHEPFRFQLVRELKKMRELKESLGFYTALLSGAGPTILVLCPIDKVSTIYSVLEKEFEECLVKELAVDSIGVQVKR